MIIFIIFLHLLKPYRPLRDLEEPDFASWVERVRQDHSPTHKQESA